MDQSKIGIFISERRKAKGWTQNQLAEQLGLTDKAVSKWETGKSMPDLSLFTTLCCLLGITLNEFLAGEFISEENLKEKSNQILTEVITNWIGQDTFKFQDEISNTNSVLSLKNVDKVYETKKISTTAVKNINFQLEKGSFVGIMGASGSGKTTLLNLIATVDKPTNGRIEINGEDITHMSEKKLAEFRKHHLGFVFQEYNLIETLTVCENIALALTMKEIPKEQARQIISEIAAKLEICSVLDKYPSEISGGQRQRCACARAIAVKPSLILADEPTGALDSRSAKQLLDLFLMLRCEYHAAILMVTHDARSASYCDKIMFLKDGEIKNILTRKEESKQLFFTKILDIMAKITEEDNDVS